jgi:iron complex transport system substrate-binding protein
MIEEAGGVNAGGTLEITGDNTSGFVAMDMEKIYAMDPDIIIMSNFDPFTPEQIYNNEIADADWSQLKAVQNHRVYKIPMGIYRWSQPNVEAHLFLEWLGKLTQPEAFAEVDLKADTIEFYKTMFNYDLSEAELYQLYRTAMNETANIW